MDAAREAEMIRATNARQFDAGLDAWLAATELELTETFRGLCMAATAYLIDETPQWTGNAASNWHVRVNGVGVPFPDMSMIESYYATRQVYERGGKGEKPLPSFKIGDDPAVSIAKQRAKAVLRRVRLGDSVDLVNPAESMSGEAYIEQVEANPRGYLRPENDPGHMVERTAHYIAASYPRLDASDITHLRGRLV
jgi:hypothetical protein